MKIALFPGSFDPFTAGHFDVLEGVAPLFDKVVVAVGYNHLKRGMLDVDMRVALIRRAVEVSDSFGSTDIEVISYSGLTADLYRKIGACAVIRGVRTTADFESEKVIDQANRFLEKDFRTLLVPSSDEYSFVSSTVVRDILLNGGDVNPLLPKGVDINDFINKE